MPLRPLILPAEVGQLARPCYADEALLTQIIAESEREDIRPRIGATLFIALKSTESDADLTGSLRILLLGGEWTDNSGRMHYLDGIKVALAYYTYGRVIRDGNITSTRYGAVIKSDDNSNSASDNAERQRQYRQAFDTADTMIVEAVNYITAMKVGGYEDCPGIRSNRAKMSVIGNHSAACGCESERTTIISGKEGPSAYDVAVANGFRGSVEDWLASLVGPQGPEGPQGPQSPSVSLDNYYDKTEVDALLADKSSASDVEDAISEEAAARENSDQSLGTQIVTLENNIGESIGNIEDKVDDVSASLAVVQSNLETEQAARVAADASLGARISDEEAARKSSDDSLSASIADEATKRRSEDSRIEGLIGIERNERAAADASLELSKQDAIPDLETIRSNAQNASDTIARMVESGYLFAGIATIDTNPGIPNAKVFYIANGKGTYEKFGGINVTEDEVVVLYWDSAWHKVATGIASQAKLSELDEKIRGIHFSEEKTFNSASSIIYFSGLGLHSGDKISVKISGTALWSTAWLYGDAGTMIGSKILEVKQNNTYEITLTSDTNTIGLRIYDLSSAGDVRIDLTKKKGELDLLYGYTDSKTEGLKIVGLDKGYEVISWDVLIADKDIQAKFLHPKTSTGYNLIKLHCKAGDLLRITNISASIGTAVLSICNTSFIGNDNQFVIPIIISQQSAATNYDWEAPFDCDIVICYYTTSTPVITKFSSPLVESVAVAENLSWQGKTVVCFGDSLTEFAENGQGYGDWIAKFTGANVIRVGIGGGELRQRTIPVDNPTNNNAAYAALDIYNMVKSSCEQDFTKQIAAANWLRDNVGDDNTAIIQRLVDIDWSKVDAVTILGGTNDWHNSPDFFGESGSTDANYTLGAINEIIRMLTSTYKHISLYWFTTIVRYETPSGTSIIDARVHENWSDVWQNSAGMTLKDTIQPIIAEVSNNKIPVCDMYNTLGWNENNFSQYFNIDNTHPYNGFKQMAKKMIGFINANRTF